jgi:hypothetical protein
MVLCDQRSKSIEEHFLLRDELVVSDQSAVVNLFEPLQLPFKRGIRVGGRSRSRIVASVYRGSIQGELLISAVLASVSEMSCPQSQLLPNAMSHVASRA